MQKLTLSVDGAVVERAKRYAAARGTSVSKLVETMLDLMAHRGGAAGVEPPPPVLAKLRGTMKRGGVNDYRRYLERKYR